MNDLHVLYKLLAYSQERSREYWGIRWSGTGSIKHNAIQKFAKEKKRWSLKKLTFIWGFLLVPLKKRLLAKIFSRWYLSVALAFPCWKEEKGVKQKKEKRKKHLYWLFQQPASACSLGLCILERRKWTEHLELSRISFSWSKEKWRFKKYLKFKNVPCCRVHEKKVSFSKIPVDDGNGKDFHFPLARLHIQSLSFLVRWTFYEICPIRTGNNRDESGGDCEFAFKHRANICLQTSSMPINISFPDNATDKLKMKKGLGGLILIVVKPL